MKKPSIELKKYNFKWENISPTSIGDNIKTTNVYSELIICGASGGVAIKSIDDDQNSWRIINKASDGTAINNIKSAKILQSKLSIFTSGNGYFVDNEGEVTRKTSENSSLPSNNINRLKAFSSVNGRTIESFYACTDKGLYNGIIDDDEDYAIITTTEGLPSNNVIDFAINNSYCIYVTDRGLASSKTTVPLNNKINIISNISFIKNDEFLFVATEFDFSSKEKTCFVVTSTNKVATSFDNGDTWENMTPPNLDNRKITCVTVDDSTIYIGTNDGLFISHKNKKIWYHYKKEDGLSGNIITDISIDVQDGKAIVVSTENGLNKGVFFNWSISTIPEVNEIFSLVKVVDGLQTTGVF
ncbi:hypothetical protein, partial [Citrobacter braakii]|uniref:hypothetical protein n=3 Tax=Citrobacter TaxID=544 RepID=UPI001CAA8A10